MRELKITVDVDKLKGDIKAAQEQYEKDYVKLMILYNKKLAEYSTYVDRYVTEHKTSTFKYPPSRPTHIIDAFVKNVSAFNAHTLPILVMENSEYNNILSGIERLQTSINQCSCSIASVSYVST